MKLSEWLNFDITKIINIRSVGITFNDYDRGLIWTLCDLDATLNSTPKLKEIFYPNNAWVSDQASRLLPDDLHYMIRSGNKEVLDVWLPFAEYTYNRDYTMGVVPTLLQAFLGIGKLLYPFYEEHVDNWVRLYEVLTEPYRPFSNYYLDEEMVRNEKTGTDNAANETTTTSTNRSTGSSTDNENGTSGENTSGEVTDKVQGYNSTSFVDSEKNISSGSDNRDYANSSASTSLDESEGSSSASGSRDRTYEEQKTYLLRYTGALDVDFQEWVNREIELRRRQLINEVIFADLDEYLVKGVW